MKLQELLHRRPKESQSTTYRNVGKKKKKCRTGEDQPDGCWYVAKYFAINIAGFLFLYLKEKLLCISDNRNGWTSL